LRLWHGSPVRATYGREYGPASSSMRGDQMRLLFVLLLIAGCGRSKEEGNGGDQRARDSVIGASKLPGAAGVRGALRAADSAAVRNSRIDSVER
jgi:hypothetical protein